MPIDERNSPAEDFDVEDYLLYLLARASSVTSRQFHAIVKSQGLGVPEWQVLATISDAPRGVGELAELTLLQQSTLSKVIDRMSQQGWVRRARQAGDGRAVMVEITAGGRDMVTGLQAEASRHENSILADYSDAEARQLKNMLKELIDRSVAQQ